MVEWIEDKGLNNTIIIKDNVKRVGNIQVRIHGNNNKILIGEYTKLGNGLIEVRNNYSEISIGEKCVINGMFRCRADETMIKIGDKTTMMNVMISLHEKGSIILGEDCMLSGDIRMDVSDMHSILDALTMKRINPAKDIRIGNHVWIGQGVHILKGCIIEDNSIVGAKSLVSTNIPSGCIAVGIPAKVVRQGVTWDRQRLPVL